MYENVFPETQYDFDDGSRRWVPDGERPGLTKRELFAAMALQGLLANEAVTAVLAPEEVPSQAVFVADELIKLLEKTNG